MGLRAATESSKEDLSLNWNFPERTTAEIPATPELIQAVS